MSAKIMSTRLASRLANLKSANRAGFVPFIMAGDPSLADTAALLAALPAHGADIIELGIPFSDPMADGPTIQAAGLRALANGFTLGGLLDSIRQFRQSDTQTPLILMSYSNPIFHYGTNAFMKDAAAAGVDGIILVDVPQEEMASFRPAADAASVDLIRLLAPPSLADRVPLITADATGFVYYIAIKGITGTASADFDQLSRDVAHIRSHTALPTAAGFGIKSVDDVAAVSAIADLVIVGSAIVEVVATEPTRAVEAILERVALLACGIVKR